MLKPSEVKNYEFKPAGRNAYKADDVDTFFAEVAISYEKMFRENGELIKRISLLADRLEQYKNDEVDIKQAVLSAQKAADIIIRDAQESVEDSKNEAAAILAAAKGEATVIKQDAEKQAIVDSDLLMTLAKNKAEDIINKAKEKAHGILIAANNSANDKVGAANRTITSESLHYDMLKKEVSEFRASILAQYKTHIELISKLPELAIEEAAKVENESAPVDVVDIDEETLENPVFVEADPDDSVLEFSDEEVIEFYSTDDEDTGVDEESEEDSAGEPVVKTTLPFDFFGEESELEFIDDGNHVDDMPVSTIADDGSIGFSKKNPLPVENVISDYIDDESTDSIVSEDSVSETEDAYEIDSEDDVDDSFESAEEDVSDEEAFSEETDDLSDYSFDTDITDSDDEDDASDKSDEGGSLSQNQSYSAFFDAIESIDIDDFEEEKPKHRGFFHRNK